MEIRRAREDDLGEILNIYELSRKFMRKNGNADQWANGYPGKELVESYIKKDGYVVTEGNNITGVFALSNYEEVYDSINGAWLNDLPYGVIHVLATGGERRGAGQFVLDWCMEKTGNIRIDTHRDNIPMRTLLGKNGYEYCGTVTFGERGERMAFQKVGG